MVATLEGMKMGKKSISADLSGLEGILDGIVPEWLATPEQLEAWAKSAGAGGATMFALGLALPYYPEKLPGWTQPIAVGLVGLAGGRLTWGASQAASCGITGAATGYALADGISRLVFKQPLAARLAGQKTAGAAAPATEAASLGAPRGLGQEDELPEDVALASLAENGDEEAPDASELPEGLSNLRQTDVTIREGDEIIPGVPSSVMRGLGQPEVHETDPRTGLPLDGMPNIAAIYTS